MKASETLADKLNFIEAVKLSPLGNSWVMRCYFHQETTPSMVLCPSQGTYVCYGCGKTGNLEDVKYER